MISLSNSFSLSLGARSGGGEAPYSFTNAEAAAYVARMSVQPDNTRKSLIDTLFGALKVGATSGTNILDKLDAIHLVAAHDAQAGLLNIISASYNLILEGDPVFTADRGYANANRFDGDALSLGVGTSGLVKLLSAAASASMGAWVRTTTTNQSAIISNGVTSGNTWISLQARTSANIIAGRFMNSTAIAGSAVGTGYGLTSFNRNGTTWQIYKDGVAAGSGTTTAGARSADILKFNGEHQYAVTFVGGQMSAAENLDFFNALNAYLTAIGVAPLATATATLARQAVARFPDGDAPYLVAGEPRGLNSLGLHRDRVDGSWWIARGIGGGSMTQAGVAHMSADPTTGDPLALLSDWTLTEINATDTGGTITDLAAGSCQGITEDTTTGLLWFINKVANQLVCINKSGVIQSVFTIGSAANGLAYDAIRDKFIVLLTNSNIVWYNKDGTVASGSATKTIQFSASGDYGDQIWHDPVNDWLYVSRDISQSADHHVNIWRLSDPQHPIPYKATDYTLEGARAIEGVSVGIGNIWVTGDGSFHGGNSGPGARDDNHWGRYTHP